MEAVEKLKGIKNTKQGYIRNYIVAFEEYNG